MFNIDHPIVNSLNKITDIIILNLIVIVLSLPIITIGATWTAMYYVTIKMVKNEESYILKDFFKSFKQNFLQSTVIWLINLILLSLFGINIMILGGGSVVNISRASLVLVILMAFILFSFMTYVYPLQARYYNPVRITIKNALLLSLANLPYTVLFIVVSLLPFIILLTKYGVYISPVIILIGFSGPAYICSKTWRKIFDRLDPQEATEDTTIDTEQ